MGGALAATPYQGEDDHMELVAKFFKILAEKESGSAIDYAFGTNPTASLQPGMIAQVKLQYAGVEPLVGKLYGFDIFIDEVMFDRYAYVLAMAAYEKQPIKIEFLLYKPADKWFVQNFLFNSEIVSDVKAAALINACDGTKPVSP